MIHVRLREVTKRFGQVVAVDRVSLEVPEGSFTTLLGPSGCGKTTLLRLIAGFYYPDAGEVFIRDTRVTDVPAHRRNAAMVFQEYALFPHMTVAENVGYGLRMRRVPGAEQRRRIQQVLELVGLSGQEHKFPHQLSGGQQQRVALARALVVEPEVLLLDEPLSNLDAKLRVRVRTEIRQLQQQLRKTVIYVTHDQEEALAISDRIAVMEHGRIQQIGTPLEIYHHPANRFVADFVGLANFLEGEMRAGGQVRAGEIVLLVPDGPRPGTRVTLVLRPEAIRLHARPPQEAVNVLRGRVTTASFLGTLARYWVDAAGRTWLVDVPSPGEGILSGEVFLEIPRERIHILGADRGER
ncbi:MAG: ABC transporter ATP-binding protein [Armatimonadota bacterium]|nr:ABC transporter ATP-binding protein [Armatimonadota bacterium]